MRTRTQGKPKFTKDTTSPESRGTVRKPKDRSRAKAKPRPGYKKRSKR